MLKAKILFLVLLAGLVSGCNPGGNASDPQAESDAQKQLKEAQQQLAKLKESNNKALKAKQDEIEAIKSKGGGMSQADKDKLAQLEKDKQELQEKLASSEGLLAQSMAALEAEQKKVTEAQDIANKAKEAETAAIAAKKQAEGELETAKTANTDAAAALAEIKAKGGTPEQIAAAQTKADEAAATLAAAEKAKTEKEEALTKAQNDAKDAATKLADKEQELKEFKAQKEGELAALKQQLEDAQKAADQAKSMKVEDLLKEAENLAAAALAAKNKKELALAAQLKATTKEEREKADQALAKAEEEERKAIENAERAAAAKAAMQKADRIKAEEEAQAKALTTLSEAIAARAKLTGQARVDAEVKARPDLIKRISEIGAQLTASIKAITDAEKELTAAANTQKVLDAAVKKKKEDLTKARKDKADAEAGKAKYPDPNAGPGYMFGKTYTQIIADKTAEIPVLELEVKKAEDNARLGMNTIKALEAKVADAKETKERIKGTKDSYDLALKEMDKTIADVKAKIASVFDANFPNDEKKIVDAFKTIRTWALGNGKDVDFKNSPETTILSSAAIMPVDKVVELLDTIKVPRNAYVSLVLAPMLFPGYETPFKKTGFGKFDIQAKSIPISFGAYVDDFMMVASNLFFMTDEIQRGVYGKLGADETAARNIIDGYYTAVYEYVEAIKANIGLVKNGLNKPITYDNNTGKFYAEGKEFNIFFTLKSGVAQKPEYINTTVAAINGIKDDKGLDGEYYNKYKIAFERVVSPTNKALVDAFKNAFTQYLLPNNQYTAEQNEYRSNAIFESLIKNLILVYPWIEGDRVVEESEKNRKSKALVSSKITSVQDAIINARKARNVVK